MKSIYNYLLIILLTSSLGGCVDNNTDIVGPTNVDEVAVSFHVSVPVDNIPATRQALGELSGNAQENMIQKIDILAFKVNPDNSEYFDYYAEGKLISGAGTPKQTFHATMRIKDYKQRFVIITNAHDEVMKLISSVEWGQAPKDEMLKMLEFANKASGHKWNASNTGVFTPFPMWGEMETPQLITSSTTSVSSIPILRMVAKIDVVVAENDAVSGKRPRDNFKLAEVYLYNVKDNGHVVPDRSALVFTTPANLLVNKPTIPVAPANWVGPLKYTTDDEISLASQIYTLEAKATDLSKNRLDATGLVIGGYYSKDGVTWDNALSYYRLDMMTSDKTTTRDVLRNHNYEVRIIEIKGPGNPTPEIAWSSATAMDLIVADWTVQTVQGDMGKRQLNTSTAKVSITGVTSSRIYFWTDQKSVKIEDKGFIGTTGNTSFNVNDYFDDLAGGFDTSMFHYNPQTGEGYMDIATLSVNETDNNVRRIYLNAGGLRREIIVDTEVKYQPQPFNIFPWVGTFHRSNEVGERIIYSDHVGEWSAEVDDPKKKGSFVILSKVPSDNKNVGTDSPGSAEDYPVHNGEKQVYGKGRIYFRVGMTSKYTPTAAAPARYATITVKYTGGIAKIYVRQGEGADYLMRDTDKPTGQSSLKGRRTMAKRFSPYNLTDPNRQSGRVGNETNFKYVFTEYPTQGGYYIQFGRTYAWYPDIFLPQDWMGKGQDPVGFWEDNKAKWECSPAGYRRPRDGNPGDFDSFPNANNSEVRQSLWLNPRDGEEESNDNILWGYYADGFFDRRQIRTSHNGVAASVVGSDAELAYIGQLYFNPYNNASLFIPASGLRLDHDKYPVPKVRGELQYTGQRGFFWFTSKYDRSNAWYISNDQGRSVILYASLRYGFPIRCVKDE